MSSRPVLVLVHGTRFDERQWVGYAELVPGADVVTVDLPGHGSRAGAEWSADEAVDIVVAALNDARHRDRRTVLAGHSLGGYVAASVAEARPDLVGALVLIGACADPARHPVLRHLYTGFARVLTRVGAERMSRVSNTVMRRLGATAAELPGTEGYAALPTAWASTIASASATQLAALTCPVFLVGGQFDQLRIDTAAYARACHDPRVRVIPRATHLAPITHRPQVAAILREAVASVSPG